MNSLLRISEAGSLALHAMDLLAREPDRVLSNREIASALGASEAHLSKVLQRLVKEGLVRSVRGRNGGFILREHPDEITLLRVYEAIEGPLLPDCCLLGASVCARGECIMGDLLSTVNRLVGKNLSETVLSALTRAPGKRSVGKKRARPGSGKKLAPVSGAVITL